MTKPFSLILIASFFALLAAGCDAPTHSKKPPPQMPAVADNSAEETARSWLLLTQTLLRAREHKDQAAESTALAGMRRLLYQPSILADRLTDDEMVRHETNTANNWSAGIAYYSEGYEWDGLRADAPRTANGPVEVRVPARGKTGAAVISLLCVSTDQGWRIRAIHLLPESAAAAPESQPAASAAAAASTPSTTRAPASQP